MKKDVDNHTGASAATDMKQELNFQIILQQPNTGVDFGLQKGSGAQFETLQRQRASGKDLLFSFRADIINDKDGQPDFKGPIIQGPPGGRFVYIGIGSYAGQAGADWDRRLKIPLRNITWELINGLPARPGAGLSTIVPGKGKDGTPNCGTVKPFDGWKPAP